MTRNDDGERITMTRAELEHAVACAFGNGVAEGVSGAIADLGTAGRILARGKVMAENLAAMEAEAGRK